MDRIKMFIFNYGRDEITMHNIDSKINQITKKPSHDEFIFDFLLAYDIPKSNIDRVRK